MASPTPTLTLSVNELQKAALAEALRRSNLEASVKDVDQDGAAAGAPSSTLAALTLDDELDAKELLYRLHEANALNEARRRAIVEQLHRLGKQGDGDDEADVAAGDDGEGTLRAKELQLARLDFEIAALEKDMSLPSSQPSIISSLATRQSLLSSIDQYQALVTSARQDVENENRAFADERKLRKDLERMKRGIGRAKERIEQANEMDTGEQSERTLGNLRTHLSKTEKSLSELLNTLIQTINSLFPDAMPAEGEADASTATVVAGGMAGQSKAEARKRAQLRALLDALMNRAWDHPGDPYVDLYDPETGARIRRYPPHHVEFLIRAGIALEHPRDARRIRLVPFQN